MSRKTIDGVFKSMGTEVSFKVVSDSEARKDQIKKGIKSIFKTSEAKFSRFSDSSELSLINGNLNQELKISSEMLKILLLCEKFNKISGGYFDPRIIGVLKKIGYKKDFGKKDFKLDKGKKVFDFKAPLDDDFKIDPQEGKIFLKKEIDTTGIVKGYTVDLAAKFLTGEGFKDFIVDAGGDMSIQGKNVYGKQWKIGVEGLAESQILLKLSGVGLATSGVNRKHWKINDKKFHHLINPLEPEKFSFDLKTVTVIRENTVEADGRAKSLFLMGKEKGLKFANQNKIKALFLDNNNNVYLSEAIKKHLF